jgi:hypothetical protein
MGNNLKKKKKECVGNIDKKKKKKLTWDAAFRKSRLSANLLFLRLVEIIASLNSKNLSGANRATASSNVRCTSPELCSSKHVPGRSVQSHISHQIPWAILESMRTTVVAQIFTINGERFKMEVREVLFFKNRR